MANLLDFGVLQFLFDLRVPWIGRWWRLANPNDQPPEDGERQNSEAIAPDNQIGIVGCNHKYRFNFSCFSNFSKELLPPLVRLDKMARMAPPDDELKCIRNSLAGDTEAYAALVKKYQKMVHALAFRMTGSLDDAEDLTQETFLRAYRQLDGFRGESKFSTWLCQIAVNLSLNWRARENRRGKAHSKWAESAIVENDAQDEFPDELSRRVQAALNRLPAKQRAAVVLTIYENCTHAEAAKLLNCMETTISWRVFAARQKLKRWLRPISHEQL